MTYRAEALSSESTAGTMGTAGAVPSSRRHAITRLHISGISPPVQALLSIGLIATSGLLVKRH